MPEDAQQSQQDQGSAPSMITKSYLATLLCDDGPSVEASNGSGVMSRAVKAHLDNDPVWAHKHGEPPDQLFVSTDLHEYDVHVRQEPVNAEGYANFSLPAGGHHDTVLSGLSVKITCDRGISEWVTRRDERGPWTLPVTFEVSPDSKLSSPCTWLI
jgi:hypothetical protein